MSFSPYLFRVLLTGVLLVNGWTDAPNAIASAVGSGALPFRRAAALAALCNLLGVLLSARFCPAVTRTVLSAVSLGPDPLRAGAALSAALLAVVLWAVLGWWFGIPTSESHALLSALGGAVCALPGGLANLDPGPWAGVLGGLGLSLLLGGLLGHGASVLLRKLSPSRQVLRSGQVIAAGAMALLHGAQDGQKFLGVFLLGSALTGGSWGREQSALPALPALFCALAMTAGTLMGGKRIVDHIGSELVPLSPLAGLSADVGSGLALLLCTLMGLPVSTTHTKTAAILSAGTACGGRPSQGAARSILLLWLLTFPACWALGFLLCRLALL